MSNEWEVVSKGGKHKPKPQMSLKEQKRIYQNNLNNNKYRLAFDEDTDKSLSPDQNKVQSQAKTKKLTSQKSENDINKQINNINGDKVKKIHAELLAKFPGQTTVSLLDLAVHLGLMVKTSEESIKSVNFDQIDYPSVMLSKDAKSALNSIFTNLSNTHIQTFLKAAMNQLLDDFDKGVPSIGLRILIQICIKLKSNIFITNRENFFDLLNVYREQTVKFKLLTWVLKQACSNYNMACQIWLIYFLPFISQRCHTEYVIAFGEDLRNYPIDVTGNDTSLSVSDFVPIIDLIFIQNFESHQNDKKSNKKKQANFQLTNSQIDRLKLIYPKIKEQAFLSKSPGALKDYFASLFLRLSANNRNELLNKELLDCLDHCLKMSPEVINQLSNLHLKYPQQTKIFLAHLNNDKSAAAATIKKSKSFKSMMDKIHSSTLAAPAGSVHDNLHELSQNCRSKKSSPSFIGFLFRLLAYLIVAGTVISLILYYQYPQQFRILYQKSKPVLDWTTEKSTPIYKNIETSFAAAYKHVQPYTLAAMEKIKSKSTEFVVFISPIIDDLMMKFGQIIIYVREKLDETFPMFVERFIDILQTVQQKLTQLFKEFVDFCYRMELDKVIGILMEHLVTLLKQMESGYRLFIDYASKMIGNQ